MAAEVAESYIPDLLSWEESAPAPERTIYDRMEDVLRLPAGKSATLADLHRKGALKRKLAHASPLLKEVRELILRKCEPGREHPIV